MVIERSACWPTGGPTTRDWIGVRSRTASSLTDTAACSPGTGLATHRALADSWAATDRVYRNAGVVSIASRGKGRSRATCAIARKVAVPRHALNGIRSSLLDAGGRIGDFAWSRSGLAAASERGVASSNAGPRP